ncbi:MAG TPA: DEAD/DEAH box helicase [Terriglobia bacterium]|nr:DEAD/DEAH box helicase [Terriglobia bacterium]
MALETQALLTADRPRGRESVEQAIAEIRDKSPGPARLGGVTAIHHIPARAAEFVRMPGDLEPRVARVLKGRGIRQLYSHQAEAFRLAREGRNLVVVTPTASGKTLCYNLPILDSLVRNPDARALYLFPTKALSQDQLTELNRFAAELGDDVRTFTYDGDTPQDARKSIRARGNLVITNPDMLHAGILPHHTKWERLFENLQYVVIDELHYYRGVLGSHLANVLRRLKRVARFYGSHPQFICASATIANPADLAAHILEEDVTLLDRNGAPASDKYLVFYNPPVVNPQLGIRRSYLNESRRMARTFLGRGLETIVFANSRLATEILVTYLKEDFRRAPGGPDLVRGYRGGYLPLERREIERHLREGRLLGVVATNALELGIDIGSLDVAVLAGYPGTIASTWQRAGRAGRRQGTSAAVLVASSAPLDQFIVQHPEYFFGRSPEHGFVNPDNLEILLNHLKCAAFELPIEEGERFGTLDLETLCRHLTETGFLHHTSGAWHWVSESYPADAVSLRSVSSDNFVIVDNTGEPRVLGEVDFPSALTTLHEKAIYIQNGEQYHVERLDYDDRKAYVHRVDSDYYTDAISYTKITVLETFESRSQKTEVRSQSTVESRQLTVDGRQASVGGPQSMVEEDGEFRVPDFEFRSTEAAADCQQSITDDRQPSVNHGEVHVNTQVVGFKKIKFHTHENVGAGNLTLPEQEMHTTAWWLTLPHEMLEAMPYSSTDRQDGVRALGNALEAMAILLVMCDARDLGVAVGENSRDQPSVSRQLSVDSRQSTVDSRQSAGRGQPARDNGPMTFFEPNIYLYDKYPGGIGLSAPLYRMSEQLLGNARKLIGNCGCEAGCPSCVGPVGEIGENGKEVALAILGAIGAGAPGE